MSTATPPTTPAAPPLPTTSTTFARYGVTALPIRRFTVQEYHRLIEQGYLAEGERCELLEGWIVAKMSQNPPHAAYVTRAGRRLDKRLPPGWHVRIQCAVTTAESEPEPDLAVVAGDDLDYQARHPGPRDVAPIVEVSSSTPGDDRTMMGRIYARAGFPVYWIINLVDRQIEVYTDPTGAGPGPAYRQRRDYRAGDVIPLLVGGSDAGPLPVVELMP